MEDILVFGADFPKKLVNFPPIFWPPCVQASMQWEVKLFFCGRNLRP